MLASLAAVAVVVVGGFFALRQVAIDEAERGTRDRVQAEARLVEAAGLSDGVLRGDRAAIRRLDDLVLGQIVRGSVVRVKLWSKDGTILYSDEPALIGKRFSLGEDERRLFQTGGARGGDQRPPQAREPLRAAAGQAARGAHARSARPTARRSSSRSTSGSDR